MKIYGEERSISDKIKSSTAVSFLLEPEKASSEDISKMSLDFFQIANAKITDTDLYYHKSILVTTSWNANDDVFLPGVVWAAKDTPIHKPTNLNHESSKIVGHMTGSWAIDTEGKQISYDTAEENLPTKFHILTGSVIYKKYHNDPDYENTVAELIEEIEQGKQFVSMECSLQDFSYAIQHMDDPSRLQILNRNEETAFLTKYLRSYGGDGFYDNYRIGRALRNISFIGKAYTPKPANKESIIFTSKDVFDFANASFFEKYTDIKKISVLSDSKIELNGDHSMSDLIQEQNKELKDKNASLAAEVDNLKAELAKADVQKFETRIKELETAVQSVTDKLAAKEAELTEKTGAVAEYQTKATDLEKTVAELEAKVAEAAQDKILRDRLAKLVDGGVDQAVAEAKVATFLFLDDAKFDLIANEIISAANASKEAVVEEAPKSEVKTVVESTDLDEVKVTDEADSTLAEETLDVEVNLEDAAVASLQETIIKFLKNREDK